MNPRNELAALYVEWQQLTVAETRAIEACAWVQAGQIQTAKSALQPAILAVTDRLKSHHSPPGEVPAEYRDLLAALIQLEQLNCATVASRLAAARAERTRLGRSASQLRDVRRAYVMPRV